MSVDCAAHDPARRDPARRDPVKRDPAKSTLPSPRARRRRVGLGEKVLALAVVPILLMAAVTAYTMYASNRLLDDTLAQMRERQAEVSRIDAAVAASKDSILALQSVIAGLNDVHHRSLLRARPELAGATRAHRERVKTAVNDFRREVDTLSDSLRGANLLDASDLTVGTRKMMLRRLGYLERSRVTLQRLLMFVEAANDRTLAALESDRISRAVNNFIYEERARFQAVHDRLDRMAAVIVALSRDVSRFQEARNTAQNDAAQSEAARNATYLTLVLAFGVIGVALLAVIFALQNLTHPFARMIGAMRRLAHGELDTEIPRGQSDELEDMAQALTVFKANAAEADRANRAKSEFLATMSHELRTPLNAILGYAEILKDELMGPLGSEKYRGYAADIHHSGRHLLDLINDVLDLSKVEAGHYKMAKDRVRLDHVLEQTLALVRPQAGHKGLTLHHHVDLPPPILLGDERALKQILLNLIWNATKYTPENGAVTVEVRRGVGVEVIVKDNGPGIPLNEQDRVFEPFAQGKAARKDGVEGTGLGLALSRRLAEMHEADLTLESAEGAGTTIRVCFPARRVAAG
mgnify:CR=1 FL=1